MCIKGEYLHRPIRFCGGGQIGHPRNISAASPVPVPFQKPWLNYAEQVALLKSRGLVVNDPAAAAWFLGHVNYYRFSGYCLAFEDGGRHTFAPGTTFEQVRGAYDFDFALRDLLCEALEIVEIDLRTAVAHHFGERHGAFGHTDPANFNQAKPARTTSTRTKPRRTLFTHADWLTNLRREAKRSKELFVLHFKDTYTGFPDLPVWVATESMSFGSLSWMIEGMTVADQRAVASRYGIQQHILRSWVHHLNVARNTCAHHGRLWDRFWSVRPELPAGKAWQTPHLIGNERLSVTLLILYRLLKRCLKSPVPDPFPANWRNRVNGYLNNLPAAPDAATKLGLTPDWFAGPLWQ